MTSRQESRSEDTKRAILSVAGQLFAERGFAAVTMREIAKVVGCSHTTIYIYFKDKEALLHQLSMQPLQSLREQLESIHFNKSVTPEDRLREICKTFIHFCLQNRTMYNLFFMTHTTRVDLEEPAMEIQKIRNQMFGLFREAVQEFLQLKQKDDLVLSYARVCFYTLHGIIGTYKDSDEPLDLLMQRITPTFDLAVEAMLSGFKQTLPMELILYEN